jgi:hypothetical protein
MLQEDEKRLNFLDSGIWNRYLSLDDIIQGKLRSVLEGYLPGELLSKSLQTNVAKEFIEFNSRLLKQSYLHAHLAHSSDISPYYFHSETEMAKKTDDLLENFVDKKYNLKWRLLLIDDFCKKSLTGYQEENDADNFSKTAVIKALMGEIEERMKHLIKKKSENKPDLRNYYDREAEARFAFDIIGVDDLNAAQTKLKYANTKYDIILLDFLLGHRKLHNENLTSREYINELLEFIDHADKNDDHDDDRHDETEEIKKLRKEIIKNKCPLNYFWFFPITSFTTALFDKLREGGLLHHSRHWHLARGADPVNTPELFKYSLLKFMELQINEVDFEKETLVHHLQNGMTFSDQHEVRDWAKSYYQIFISNFGKFHIIKQDRDASLFSQSMYKFMINNRTEQLILYEKMRNFLFLLANGTYDDCGQLIKSHEELMREITIKQEDREAGKENEKDLDENRNETIKEKFNILRDYIYNLRR